MASRVLARCDPAWYGLRDDPPRLFAAARAMVELCATSQWPGPDGRMVDVEPILPSRLLAVAAEELGIDGQALHGLVAEFIGEHAETLRRLEEGVGAVTTDLASILAESRRIWGPPVMTLPEVAVCAAVVVGDLARAARDAGEGRPDTGAVAKELGNLIVSGVRWADELGLDAAECVTAALEAQEAYVERRSG